MKKFIFTLLTAALLYSCGGGTGSNSVFGGGDAVIPEKFDHKILTNEAEIKRSLMP